MLATNWPENDHLHNIGNRSILALQFWRYLGQLIDHFKLRFLPDDYFLVALKPRDASYIAFNCLVSPIPNFSLVGVSPIPGSCYPSQALPLGTAFRARICKRLRAQESIPKKESIPQACVAWRAGMSKRVVVPAQQAGNRLLGSLKSLQFGL
jgi:hypothetical protein